MIEIRCDACKKISGAPVYRVTDDRLHITEADGVRKTHSSDYCHSEFDLCQECRNKVLDRLIELGVEDSFWHYPDFETTNKKAKIAK
jgi:hypothetical protein